jgi:hypothetical protein
MIHGTHGARFYIGTDAEVDFATDAAAIADFDDDTYVEVQWLQDMGDFGAESEIYTRRFIDKDYTEKRKGARDAGVMNLVVGRDPLDPGQAAMLAAEADTSNVPVNFKVVLNDKPEAAGTPSAYYFKGLVASARVNLGDEANQTTVTFAVAISGRIVGEMAALAVEP